MGMGKAGAVVVRLDAKRYDVLLSNEHISEQFAEAVDDFTFSRNQPLIALIVNPSGELVRLGRANRGFRAATGMRRLNIHDMVELRDPITSAELGQGVSKSVRHWVLGRLDGGGLLPPKSFQEVVDTIIRIRPETREILGRFSAETRARIARLTPNQKSALAHQKESIATALTISGMSREPLADWSLDSDDAPKSYLDGLPKTRMREDPMVVSDMARVPGFRAVRSIPNAATNVFHDGQTTLSVTLANRLPLEQQTGTDLIYYNETFKAFVMVQYKAMEADDKNGAVFRLPQPQLSSEIERMDDLLAKTSAMPDTREAIGFRLSKNPFFLKFCPRIQFDPDDTGLTKGMYLPLDYWKSLEADPKLVGPRGGRMLTYSNVGRYVDNTSFAMLVSKAWVGTSIQQSTVLEEWIQEIVQTGRAIAFAIKKSPPDDSDVGGEFVFDPSPDLDQGQNHQKDRIMQRIRTRS